MSLFDEIQRVEDHGAEYGESHYDYLNRSGRAEFETARKKIDGLFLRYETLHPKSTKDIRGRFQSKDNRHHLGATTELFTHDLLLQNGFDVVSHPEIDDKTSHPDFLATKNGVEIYVEVATVVGGSDGLRMGRFQADILDTVNELHSPDFLVSVDFEVISSTKQPAVGKIKKKLQEFVTSLNYQLVCATIEQGGAPPVFLFEQEGWRIKFTATPVKEEARQRRLADDTRSIGYIMHPVRSLHTDEMIRDKIKEKRQKYGQLTKPLVVVINAICDGFFVDNYTIMAALFGKEKITWTNYSDGTSKTTPGRTMDGAWIEPSGRILAGVSGVLIVSGLYGWNIEKVQPKIWVHPKANYPLAPGLFKVLHKILNPKTDMMEEVGHWSE